MCENSMIKNIDDTRYSHKRFPQGAVMGKLWDVNVDSLQKLNSIVSDSSVLFMV